MIQAGDKHLLSPDKYFLSLFHVSNQPVVYAFSFPKITFPLHRAMMDILETIWNIVKKGTFYGFILFLFFLGHGFEIPTGNGWPASSFQNKNFLDWAITQINASIYWVWHDALWISQWIYNCWQNIPSPLIKFGVLFGFVLFAQNFRFLLKGTILKNKLSVYCPIDNLPGRPIPGTVDRYRCRGGHQFAGEAHDFHHI